MATGLEVFDGAGNLVFSPGTTTLKFLGFFTVGGYGTPMSGSFADGRLTSLPGHTPFYILVNGNSASIESGSVPDVSFSGNTVYWSFQGNNYYSCRIVYGIY